MRDHSAVAMWSQRYDSVPIMLFLQTKQSDDTLSYIIKSDFVVKLVIKAQQSRKIALDGNNNKARFAILNRQRQILLNVTA